MSKFGKEILKALKIKYKILFHRESHDNIDSPDETVCVTSTFKEAVEFRNSYFEEKKYVREIWIEKFKSNVRIGKILKRR